MTEEMMNLRGLMAKCAGADVLCRIIGFAVERLIKLEVRYLTSVARGEKRAERLRSSATPAASGTNRPGRASLGFQRARCR